jgi:hypothetical protein
MAGTGDGGRRGKTELSAPEHRTQEENVMKKRTQRTGEVRGLSVSCQQQLNAYALAAAAAGVSALALAAPSEAKIIYTPTHQVIGDGSSYKLDFTGKGTTELTIQNDYNYWGFHSQELAARQAESNQVAHNYFGAVAMSRGQQIGPKCVFSGGLEEMAELTGTANTSGVFGSWINVNNRYLGTKFYIGGKVHYGWVRLSVQVELPRTITATVTGYAYETVPNKPIVAGKTSGPDVVTVGASLGGLAQGSAGLAPGRSKEYRSIMRQRQFAKEDQEKSYEAR